MHNLHFPVLSLLFRRAPSQHWPTGQAKSPRGIAHITRGSTLRHLARQPKTKIRQTQTAAFRFSCFRQQAFRQQSDSREAQSLSCQEDNGTRWICPLSKTPREYESLSCREDIGTQRDSPGHNGKTALFARCGHSVRRVSLHLGETDIAA